MTWLGRLLACAILAVAAMTTCGCTEGGGIGMGVPSSGARWGGSTANPSGVIVGGGPVYR